MIKTSQRETWLDNVKGLACVLVALGHLFQGINYLIPSQYLHVCVWFNQTIYYFHVPLFFICSGYLYQKRSKVNSVSSWKENVIKKLIALGIPYFTFSLVTWVLKNVFAGAVNNETNGLLYDLFVVPQAPYWYLYALFFVFLITPTFSNRKNCIIGLAIALVLKVVNITTGGIGVYVVDVIMNRLIWFVAGMLLCVFDVPQMLRNKKWLCFVGVILLAVFVAISLLIKRTEAIAFGMGTLACAAILMLFLSTKKEHSRLRKVISYTMPIFLMHTIFAAGVRAVLLKFGVHNALLHIVAGLGASFFGPILASEIMRKLKLDVLIDPVKYICFQKKVGEGKR